jgi:hypothetical protein
MALICAVIGVVTACSREAPIEIPKVWDDDAMRSVELPLVNASLSPVYLSSDFYYRIPEMEVFRTYPIYHPDREPAGYVDELRRKEPERVFDATKLKTEEDWIRAGELIFDYPFFTGRIGFVNVPGEDLFVRDRNWYETAGVPLAADGTLPFLRYVVREKGKVEVGVLSCGACHTRVMPDGSIVKGAQGNFPSDRALAMDYRHPKATLEDAVIGERVLYWVPGRQAEFDRELQQTTLVQIAATHAAIPPGVLARHGTSPRYPVQVPDLIGIKDRRYLDHTGLQQHNSIADLMRYDAINTGGDDLAKYGDFNPLAAFGDGKMPEPSKLLRYGDARLYALAMYLYSLQPPKNPNLFDDRAKRGQAIFEREGCPACHTPPFYTNNTLIPADGFEIPDDHRTKYAITETSIGTDPNLALKTRRGTGYYKVPSLKGVWYRGPFSHDGSVATLEDWFDPNRLRDDYVPTGFKGAGVTQRAVPGHRFGLQLSIEEKTALIAFLKTL